jgi:hypothetical protein
MRFLKPARKAIALIWVALTTLLFVGFVGLSLDTGLVVFAAEELQGAADASALAAAQFVRNDIPAARTAAVNLALLNRAGGAPVQLARNDGNASNGDIVVGVFDRDTLLFTPTTTTPNAVKIVARRTNGSLAGQLPLVFGSAFGVDSTDVVRDAIAMVTPVLAGLIVLHNTAPCALDMDSNSNIDVDGGDIQVNSSNSTAVCADSNALIEGEVLHVNGGVSFVSNSQFEGDQLDLGAPPISDPLAHLPEPDSSTMTNRGTINISGSTVRVAQPGYYPGGIKLDSNARLTMEPGIYSLGGFGLQMYSNTTLIANEVMIHIRAQPNAGPGTPKFLLDSNSNLTLTPPLSGVYAGMAIFQSRTNTNTAVIDSNGVLNVSGTIYFPNNHLRLDSNAGSFGNQLIVNTLSMDSNAVLGIDYDGRNPGVGNLALVE